MSTVCSRDLVLFLSIRNMFYRSSDRVFFSNNTPGFALTRITPNNDSMKGELHFFNLVPPLRITRKVERRKSLKEIWIMVKESSPWED